MPAVLLHWSWFPSLPSLLILCLFLFKSKGIIVLHDFPKSKIILKDFSLAAVSAVGKHQSEFGSVHAGAAGISDVGPGSLQMLFAGP